MEEHFKHAKEVIFRWAKWKREYAGFESESDTDYKGINYNTKADIRDK